MPKGTIHIITTGGTIDSYYNGVIDTVEPLEKSAMPSYLKSLRLYKNFVFTELCMKDSRQITTSDRNKLLKLIKKSPHHKFIITHGTYTMPDTARFLETRLSRKGVKIILTGSLIPLTGFAPSDAGFNLGFAIASLDYLPNGVHVCMNGRVFNPHEILKLISEGRFGSIFQK